MKFLYLLKQKILPHGKVHQNYMKYIGWSCISNMVVSIESVLSTHSMLSVIGQTSSELTLSVNYIGKDIIGQLGGLWYINKIGNKADRKPLEFIKNSMILQQTAIILECLTPFLPITIFMPIAGIANISKNISFTGFGAINAKIIQKISQEDNIGEVYAKISVLNTMGSTFGMGIGLITVAYIPDHSVRICLIPILSCIRIYSYNKAINNLIT